MRPRIKLSFFRERVCVCFDQDLGALLVWCNFISRLEFFCCCFVFNFWLCWVFVSVRGLSPVMASGGHSSSRCVGLSLLRPLLLRSTGSRRAGSVVVAHGPSCSVACGIFLDQGSKPCPLHRQADSQPLRHQGSPRLEFFMDSINTGCKPTGFMCDSSLSYKYYYLEPWLSVARVSYCISHLLLLWALIFVPLDPQAFQHRSSHLLALENALRAKGATSMLIQLSRFPLSRQSCPIILTTLLVLFFLHV